LLPEFDGILHVANYKALLNAAALLPMHSNDSEFGLNLDPLSVASSQKLKLVHMGLLTWWTVDRDHKG
jgi:hypothetical protein